MWSIGVESLERHFAQRVEDWINLDKCGLGQWLWVALLKESVTSHYSVNTC
jgi:hypothetical protein